MGSIHPIRRTIDDICAYFERHGFAIVLGPEIESDYYNFDALNIPKDHPAREGLDSFYLRPDVVLRTHTSPMQIRVMEEHPAPIAVVVPGKAYRRDALDARHSYMFHQVEGLLIGTDVHFGHLKGMLTGLCRELFGERQAVRFRPSFFPFTEPSAEVDTTCPGCGGDGCRTCGGSGWIEIGGSGMVHPNVLRGVGYDPEAGRRMGVRHRPRTHRHDPLRHRRHPRVLRKRSRVSRAAGIMRVPLAWLRDYVALDANADAIAERLALLGFPVEAIETRPPLHGVVAGKLVNIAKHPNADRLQVCTVDVGGDAPLTVLTAATNVAEGQLVPVATLGAQLVGMKIEPRSMRGIASEGMLCSANELGLPEEWFEDGIMQLDLGTRLGADVVAMFRLGDEILEVEVTPNRPDAMSVLGLARELAAAFGVALRPPDTTVSYGDDIVDALSGETKSFDSLDVKVTLQSPDCHRFVVQRISYLRVRPSKTWMRVRLALAGQRPINNAVDVSNFVMLEVGQPLHFYDFDKLAGRELIVRDARDGEPMVTLDGIERTLDASFLVIADRDQPQCIAGIKGAAASEVTDATHGSRSKPPTSTARACAAWGLHSGCAPTPRRGTRRRSRSRSPTSARRALHACSNKKARPCTCRGRSARRSGCRRS